VTVDIYDGPIDRLHQHKSRVGQLPELRMLTDWAPAVDRRLVAVDGLSNLTLCLMYPRICYRPQWWASRQRSSVPVFCCCCLHQSNGLKKTYEQDFKLSPHTTTLTVTCVSIQFLSYAHTYMSGAHIPPQNFPEPQRSTQPHKNTPLQRWSAIKVDWFLISKCWYGGKADDYPKIMSLKKFAHHLNTEMWQIKETGSLGWERGERELSQFWLRDGGRELSQFGLRERGERAAVGWAQKEKKEATRNECNLVLKYSHVHTSNLTQN